MTQARLVVDLPSGPWVADVSRAYPEANFQVLAAIPGDGPGFALVWITAPGVEDILEAMQDHQAVTEMSILQHTDTEATVHFETSAPMLLVAAKRSGIPLELPVEIQDGEAILDVTGSHDRLSELGHQFEQLGLEFRVEHVRASHRPSQLLTETQQDVILAAVEQGYYDTPRECSLTELAAHIGIAKSTCSETLHRAEETIIKEFVDSLPGVIPEDAQQATPRPR